MKIILADGTQLQSQGVRGESMYFQGFQRDGLTFVFDPELYTIQEIDSAFTADACRVVGIQAAPVADEEGNLVEQPIDYHRDYVIRVSISQGVDQGASASAAPTISVKMAQLTEAEKMMAAQSAQIAAIVASMSETQRAKVAAAMQATE